MIRSVQPTVWAFDCEWVPDARAGRLLLDLPPDTPERDVFTAMWAASGATSDEPRPFLKLVTCRIASIALVERRVHAPGTISLHVRSLPKPDRQSCERTILQTFFDALDRRHPQLVGFNAHGADLRILTQRGIVLGLSAPGFCRRPDKPWEGPDYFHPYNDWNVDLICGLGGAGGRPRGAACPSLKEIALLSGIPAKGCGDQPCTGADVADLWLEGRHDDIRRYNESDAVTTYLLWLRAAHFSGCFTTAQYIEEQARVEALLERRAEAGDVHLQAYLERWRLMVD